MTTAGTIRETPLPSGGKITEYLNAAGEYHRETDPAYIVCYGNGQIEHEEFYVNGKRHRENGPAVIWYYAGGQVEVEELWLEGVYFTSEEFLYKTYIDKLANQVLREQAIQLAEQADWNITAEQLGKAVGLTLEGKPVVKFESAAKMNNSVDITPGV